MTDSARTARLASLIDSKKAVLCQLHELALRQRSIIEAGETNKLISLLAVKQAQLDQLQNLELNLETYRHEDPEQRVWSSRQARLDCQEVATTCSDLLDAIMQVEQECEQVMIHKKHQVEKQINATQSGVDATKAYLHAASHRGGAKNQSSGALDLCSES